MGNRLEPLRGAWVLSSKPLLRLESLRTKVGCLEEGWERAVLEQVDASSLLPGPPFLPTGEKISSRASSRALIPTAALHSLPTTSRPVFTRVVHLLSAFVFPAKTSRHSVPSSTVMPNNLVPSSFSLYIPFSYPQPRSPLLPSSSSGSPFSLLQFNSI